MSKEWVRYWVSAGSIFALLMLLVLTSRADAQNPGLSGQPVYNQVTQLRVVTPSDTASLPQFTRALYNGSGAACDIAVVASGDTSAVTLTAQPPGWIPLSVKKVMATNTSCTPILAGY